VFVPHSARYREADGQQAIAVLRLGVVDSCSECGQYCVRPAAAVAFGLLVEQYAVQ
jgi:hypothetical protein